MEATSVEAAQLAMLRLLWLQRQTRRAVRGRHREAAAMLARASVEMLFLGSYCLRVPEAVSQLHAGNLKALGDGFAYIEETGIVPAQVVHDCVARLGEPSNRSPTLEPGGQGVPATCPSGGARADSHGLSRSV